MWNVVVGVVFMFIGLSNTLSIGGTAGGYSIAAVGAILALWGGINASGGK